MIEEIVINEVATYRTTSSVMGGLSSLNFVFGANGTGKTTIGRIIRDQESHTTCQVKWKGNTRLTPLVYNRDFVSENFSESKDLKGVFTLGEKHVEIQTSIDTAKAELDFLVNKIAGLNETLVGKDGNGGKAKELEDLEQKCKTKCWTQKVKHDAKFQPAFDGYRNSQENFKTKTLAEYESNTGDTHTLENLENRAATLFGETPIMEVLFQIPDMQTALSYEANQIMAKRVIGKTDVDIAALINKLNNSDWIKQGRVFYDEEEMICPFCQQATDEGLKASLDEYFDEAFEIDINAINLLKTNISTDYETLKTAVETLSLTESKYFDKEKFHLGAELLNAVISANLQTVESKVKEPSSSVALASITEPANQIKEILEAANVAIKKHNDVVANLESERAQLTTDIWRFIVGIEIKDSLDVYAGQKRGLTRAIDSIKAQITTNEALRDDKKREIARLETQATGVDASVSAINSLLSSFGFTGFKLQKVEGTTSYRLIREDGSAAQATLSEGEKTFVTFLYFYHLLKGSAEESGITSDRIVVFDDPVSSLDSDILFIVSNLIKGLFEGVRTQTGMIRQIFVLTHNVYFHKEISFNPRRTSGAMSEETFWVVRKNGSVSEVTLHPDNPISTSYELLWSEVRRADRSPLTIRNTLRRIIENYFKILGNTDFDGICDKFDGRDKLICRSLFSWIHDGSHFTGDDLYISIDPSQIDRFLEVFRNVFDKMGHISHYKMMMGSDFVEQEPEALLPETAEEDKDVALAG